MQYMLVDIETSGLDPSAGACILEIGAAIVSSEMKILDTRVFTVKPTIIQWQAASPQALAVNGITLEYLKERQAKPMREVAVDFENWLVEHGIIPDKETGAYTKTMYVGQNPSFDLKFLRFFLQGVMGKCAGLVNPGVNVQDLARAYLKQPGVAEKWEGKNIYDKPALTGKAISINIGVEPEPDLHTAEGGVSAVYRNFVKLVSLTDWRPD